MLRLLAISVVGLVYLAITAHCAVVKRSALACTTTLADVYCRKHIQRSRNPSSKCEDGAIVCYLTSPRCRNAADCEDACGPLAGKEISVRSQCVSSQCRCEVSDECTESNCEERCVKESEGKPIDSWHCMPNNTCFCNYVGPCPGEDDCKSECEKEYPGKQLTSTQCGSDGACFCEYVEPCTGVADCKAVCEKEYPGKRMLSTRCGRDKQCLCEYLAGAAGTLRPSELIMAVILLTTLATIPSSAERKLWALLIPPAMFGFPISQLALG